MPHINRRDKKSSLKSKYEMDQINEQMYAFPIQYKQLIKDVAEHDSCLPLMHFSHNKLLDRREWMWGGGEWN